MISYLLILSLLAPPPPPTGSAAWRAEEAYKDGRFADAAKAFGEAYEQTGKTNFLFAQAQAERFAGDCHAALTHYDEYLRSDDTSPEGREEAEGGGEECHEALEARGETWLAPIAEPEPEEPAPLSPEEPLRQDDETDPDEEPDDRPKWPRDKLAIGLVAGGAVVAGVGFALLGAGVRLDRGAGDAPTERTFETDLDRSVVFHRAGIGIAAVGGAVLLGGVIRWAIVAKREKESSVALSPTPRGVVLSGRF